MSAPVWYLRIRMADVESLSINGSTLSLKIRNPSEIEGECIGYGFPMGMELDFSDFADRTPEHWGKGIKVVEVRPS